MAEADADPHPPRAGVRLDYTITVGHLIQICLLLTGLASWLISSNNRSDQAGKDLVVLQDRLTGQIKDVRDTVSEGLNNVRTQIAGLPDQRANLDQTLRRLGDVEQRYNIVDKRLGEAERATIESRADLNTLMRAANVPLPRGRGN